MLRRVVQKQETQCPESASSQVTSTTVASTRPCPTTGSMSHVERVETPPLIYATATYPGPTRADPCQALREVASIHNLVQLLPLYRQKLKSRDVKPITRRTKVWAIEAIEALSGCFLCTDWDVLLAGASLDEQVEIITAYVHFCVDMLIPTKAVKTDPNKLWVTKGVVEVLRGRQEAFKQGSTEDVKRLHKGGQEGYAGKQEDVPGQS